MIFIILACCLWAIDTLIRYPLIFSGLESSRLVFAEHLVLVLIFSPILIRLGRTNALKNRGGWLNFIVIGGLGSALATLAFTRAFSLINPSLVILMQKFQPLVAILLARKVLAEKMNSQFLLWGAVCLAGGVMISFDDLAKGLSQVDSLSSLVGQKQILGYFLTFVAVIGWGSSTVFGKQLSLKGYSELELMGGRFFFGLIFLIPVITTVNNPIITSGDIWLKILLMVLLSGVLGMGLYYQGLKRIPARHSALAEMFFPFCAITVNWIFLEASLAPLQIAGGLLLLLGSTVIQLKKY